MSARRRVQDSVSAGGVVWRRTADGELEVVICGRSAEKLWGLPKGTPNAGESVEQTALREVREETGLLVELGAPLGSIDYWFVARGERVHKYVHHWLMQPVGGSIDDHDHEFDAVEWVPIREAHRWLTYANERRVVAAAAGLLGAPL